jgi:hypothetical protein
MSNVRANGQFGTVIQGVITTNYQVRPVVFVNLESLASISSFRKSFQVGTCGSAVDDGINCVRFGGYAFDIIGIRVGTSDDGKSGVCKMTQTDGYLDSSGAECPDESLALLLSNQSAQKFSTTDIRTSPGGGNFSGTNRYLDSNLDVAMNNAYDSVRAAKLSNEPSYPALEDLIIPRNLAGGAPNGLYTFNEYGNKCTGENPGVRNFFPLSFDEVKNMFKGTNAGQEEPPEVDVTVSSEIGQDPIMLAETKRTPNNAYFSVFEGSGTGSYTITAAPSNICTFAPTIGAVGASGAAGKVKLIGEGVCTVTGRKAGSTVNDYPNLGDVTNYLPAVTAMDVQVHSITHAMQTADDEGFEDLLPQALSAQSLMVQATSTQVIPQAASTPPEKMYYVAPTLIPLAETDAFSRPGYHYTELCTEKSVGGQCFPAAQEVEFTALHGTLTLYPRWLKNLPPYTPENPAPPNTELPTNPDDPSEGVGLCSVAAYSESSCLAAGGVWTHLNGGLAESGVQPYGVLVLLASTLILAGVARRQKRTHV